MGLRRFVRTCVGVEFAEEAVGNEQGERLPGGGGTRERLLGTRRP
jgi:hypothetical protein